MAFSVNILAKDPDPVFEWVNKNVARENLIRQTARGVNYERWKTGAIISTCSADHVDFGWVVKVVVNNRETADRVASFWGPQTDRCDIYDLAAS